jgi:hypothetical protein
MALKAKIDKTTHEGLSEDLQKEYTETDGSFILDVTSVDGLALENVTGLKSTVEKLRQTEKDLTNSVKASQQSLEAEKAKFAGIDPEQARDLLAKVDDIKNWDGEKKVLEAVKAAEAKHAAILEELNTKHTDAVTKLQTEVDSSQTQLRDTIVGSKITEAIHSEGGNVTLLLPHVKSHVNMVKNTAGKFVPEVINDEGTPRIGDNQGNPMTIEQYVQELKGNDTFAGAFKGVNSTGPGHIGSDGTNQNTNNDNTKVIDATDEKAKSKNIENIATGKTTVNME